MKPNSGVQPCERSVVSSASQVHSTRSKRQLGDGFVAEVLLAGEDSAQQHGRIDRRYLGIPHPFTRVDIGEMVEKTAMRGQLVPQERQRLCDARAGIGAAHKTALFANADGRQGESRRGDAGHKAGILGYNVAAIFGQAGLGVRLLPEEEEIRVNKPVEELRVAGR